MPSLFRYWSRHAVKSGDRIRYCGRDGTVSEVIAPGSDEARDYDWPTGGVCIDLACDGGPCTVRLSPPDGRYWEDLEFVARPPRAVPTRSRRPR